MYDIYKNVPVECVFVLLRQQVHHHCFFNSRCQCRSEVIAPPRGNKTKIRKPCTHLQAVVGQRVIGANKTGKSRRNKNSLHIRSSSCGCNRCEMEVVPHHTGISLPCRKSGSTNKREIARLGMFQVSTFHPQQFLISALCHLQCADNIGTKLT